MSHINHCITMSMKIYRFVILFLNISILLLLKQGRPMNNNITKNQFWKKKSIMMIRFFFLTNYQLLTLINVFFCDNTTNWFFNVQSNILKRRTVGEQTVFASLQVTKIKMAYKLCVHSYDLSYSCWNYI